MPAPPKAGGGAVGTRLLLDAMELSLRAGRAVEDHLVPAVIIEVNEQRLPALRIPFGLDVALLAPHAADDDGSGLRA